jgi:transcriptional regulator with XRE-family HTH domain
MSEKVGITMARRSEPNPIDVHVGSRVRLQRKMTGVSQERLGSELGITFQQIQKYENGVNRISSSRLQQIARILSVPVTSFFEGAPGGEEQAGPETPDTSKYVLEFLTSNDGFQLNRAFARIGDPKVRQKLVRLVRAIAGDLEGDADDVGADVTATVP